MRKQFLAILPLLMFSVVFLGGCVGRSSSGSSSLTKGLNENTAAQGITGNVKVVSATPGVVAIQDGRVEKISTGMMISSSAILRSDAKGKAEVAFTDGTRVKISPNSELALADVAPASENNAKSGSSSKGLLRSIGGFSKTGETSQTTIGVRGLK